MNQNVVNLRVRVTSCCGNDIRAVKAAHIERQTGRNLRKRKVLDYSELEESSIVFEPQQTKIATNFLKILKEKKFSSDDIVKYLDGNQFTMEYIEKEGFRCPIMFTKQDGLGLTIPNPLTVDNVRALVGRYHYLSFHSYHSGSKRLIEVINVATQAEVIPQWSLEDWANYYNSKKRKKLYNVISLEVSKTKLSEQIASPATVRAMDWVDNVWPKELQEWPKVQLYCLMSVAGAYTDFHIGRTYYRNSNLQTLAVHLYGIML